MAMDTVETSWWEARHVASGGAVELRRRSRPAGGRGRQRQGTKRARTPILRPG